MKAAGRQSSPALGALTAPAPTADNGQSSKTAARPGASAGVGSGPLGLGQSRANTDTSFGSPSLLKNLKNADEVGRRTMSPTGGAGLGKKGPIDRVDFNKLDKKDAGGSGGAINASASQNLSTQSLHGNICDDSFQRLYSKELDIDEDEVPLILHELNDSAIHFISKEQYDRALSLLQKAQTLLDRLMFQRNASDRFLIQCTMHNMALCFQKMGALEECSLCLDACLTQITSPYVERLAKSDPPRKLKRLKYECKIHMQVCALLSQLNRHQEALCHAKRSVQISQYMINDLMELCETLNLKIGAAKKRE